MTTWNEADHPRGKTSEESTPGSFKSKFADEGGPSKVNPAISQEQYEAFEALANKQRGAPEMAMMSAQEALRREPYYPSANALGYALEHVGDLTHRMSESYAMYPGSHWGREYVAPKVNIGLSLLTNPVDLERMEKIPFDKFPELQRYSDAHAALPVYNLAQRAARDAAVALGKLQFYKARSNLRILKDMLDDGTFEKHASEYHSPKSLLPGDRVTAFVGAAKVLSTDKDGMVNIRSIVSGVDYKVQKSSLRKV